MSIVLAGPAAGAVRIYTNLGHASVFVAFMKMHMILLKIALNKSKAHYFRKIYQGYSILYFAICYLLI